MCSKFYSRTDVVRYSQELIDFYAMEPTTYQEILHAVEQHDIICPNPIFWSRFCEFINDEVPIDFIDLEWGPFILDIWHSTTDLEKNAQFKKQLKYLEADQKENLVTIFFGRSTPKFPVEHLKEQDDHPMAGVWYLNDDSSFKTGKADYCNHIDNLFVCGLTLKFHPKFSESYWRFGSDFTYKNKFFREGDPNLLVIIFKGLVICETNILKGSNSVSPVSFVNNILTDRLSAALYNEVAEWAGLYYALAQVNSGYRPTFQPIVRTSGSCCSSCAAYPEISKEDAELTYMNYKKIMQQRQDEKDFEKNKCPKCGQHKLKTNQTRWGKIRICSDYPKCNFKERIENSSAQNLN